LIPYAYYGTFRVYFNRHNEFPKVWSIDCGTQETETPVEAVYFVNLPTLSTEYLRQNLAGEADKFVPSAVLTGRGLVRVEADCAYVDGGMVPQRISWVGLQITRTKYSLAATARRLSGMLRRFRQIGATPTQSTGTTTDTPM
jgi:hypothetical protein